MKATALRRKPEIVAGLLVIALYVGGAAVSGRLSVLARRPLLEGSGPPPPYRWVTPPPKLAAANQKPDAATIAIKLTPPERGAGVYSTKDLQATLVVEPGAFPVPTSEKLTLSIEPLDPATMGSPPQRLTIVGNVYKLEARTGKKAVVEPSGAAVHVVLVYPLTTTVLATHTLLTSHDGQTWTKLVSADSPAAQQVSADVERLGYFAVGEAKRTVPSPKKSAGTVIVIALVVVTAGGAGVALRLRRAAERKRRAARARRPGARRR